MLFKYKNLLLLSCLAMLIVSGKSEAANSVDAKVEAVVKNTPFRAMESRIRNASAPVLYEIARKTNKNFNYDLVDFMKFPRINMENIAVQGFYFNSLVAIATKSHDIRLIEILNKFSGNPRDTILIFEEKYFEINGRYPFEYVLLDIDAIENRIIKDHSIN